MRNKVEAVSVVLQHGMVDQDSESTHGAASLRAVRTPRERRVRESFHLQPGRWGTQTCKPQPHVYRWIINEEPVEPLRIIGAGAAVVISNRLEYQLSDRHLSIQHLRPQSS